MFSFNFSNNDHNELYPPKGKDKENYNHSFGNITSNTLTVSKKKRKTCVSLIIQKKQVHI